MRVLVACECSNTVRDAFLRLGHDAWSCDLQRADHPNPNWRRHIRGDVRPLLRERWDLVIAHPPCTYLCKMNEYFSAGATSLEEHPRRAGIVDGSIFFLECLGANSPRVCVENPLMHNHARELVKYQYSQIVQPWQYGHPYTKATCLWLIGLPPLRPTNIVHHNNQSWVGVGNAGGRGKRRTGIAKDSNERSKTFPGIARAMAEQWGGLPQGE